MTDLLARLYGHLPQHRGKWRVIHALLPVQRPHEWRLAKCGDLRLWVDIGSVLGEHLYYGRAHEHWETVQVRRLVKPGDVAIDVGANIGYYSVLFSKLVGPAGRVYAFEPGARNLEPLGRNLADLPNAEIVPIAVSDRCGSAQFGGATADTLQIGQGDDTVQTTTLDAWAEERGISRLDFIKVDIEGHEVPMLRGARNTLLRFHPTLLLEANESAQRESGTSVAEMRGLLADFGYRVYRIKQRKLVPWADDPAESPEVFYNVLALPGS